MIRKILALFGLALIVGGGVFMLVRTNDSHNDSTMTVTASFYPLADFARNIGGDYITVHTVTPAGAEPHDYEPAPRDLKDINSSDVFIYNGGVFEPWTEKFAKNYKHTLVKASTGITLHDTHETGAEADHDHTHDTTDPHFWLDPVLAQRVVANIRDGLIAADPSHADEYRKNADTYQAKLVALDTAYKDGLADCKIDTVIASHSAFGYLAKRYNFRADSIAGISPDQEPSAQKLAELSNLARDKSIRYIFFEHLVSPRLADTIAQEAHAKTLVFDPIEGLTQEDYNKGKDYVSLQYENLKAIQTARACN